MVTVIAIIVVLGGLIFFHELGHFSVARMFGMGVSTFSLGFGPKLLKYKRGQTEYALSLIPLGGYVALVGENDESDIPEGFTEKDSFALRPAWQRFLVVLAGPVANLIMAWVLFTGLSFFWGTPVLLPDVGGVQKDSPAERAGSMAGDHIIAINGKQLEAWEDLSQIISESNGGKLEFEIARPDGETLNTLKFTLQAERSTRKTIFGEEETAWLVGIRAKGNIKKRPESFGRAIVSGFRETWRMIDLTCQGFVKLIERVVPIDQVGGPIMIAQLVGEQANQGLAGLLALTALISINLGILNLLPIPVLDGGAILFCCIEMVIRRPVNRKVQDYAMRVGAGLLILLMILATYNDVVRIVKG